MRIVGGRFGGRTLPARVGGNTRPTTDRVREGLASVLVSRGCLADAVVLDLFAGSGAVGLELLSRGAARVVAVDRDVRAVIRNAAALGAQAEVMGVRGDLWHPRRLLARIDPAGVAPFGIVFVDPPYAEVAEVPALLAALAPAFRGDALVIVEHRASEPLPAVPTLAEERVYRYGDTGIALLTPMS